MQNAAFDVSRAQVAPGVTIRPSFAVETKQVQNRRVEFVNVNLVAFGGKARVVRCTVDVGRKTTSKD